MLKKGSPTTVDALEEGKALYSTEDPEKLRRVYRELKKGMRRAETTVVVPP